MNDQFDDGLTATIFEKQTCEAKEKLLGLSNCPKDKRENSGDNQTNQDLGVEELIKSQESVITDDDCEHSKKHSLSPDQIQEDQDTINTGAIPQIRKSERLKKDIAISTKEKNEMMARKRNLEGTSSSFNTFSKLNIETVKSLSSNMGIAADNINFDTFDMLKDLENARNKLHNKKHDIEVIEINDDGKDEDDINVRLIEWL